ncbi:MAG: hypothetical protein J6D21_03885, partial [Clostridia bacterium]|nr:hypothetical protein [Clostridia bacterium]
RSNLPKENGDCTSSISCAENDLLIHHYRGPPSPLGKAHWSAALAYSRDGCTSSFTLFSLEAEGPKKKASQKRKAASSKGSRPPSLPASFLKKARPKINDILG